MVATLILDSSLLFIALGGGASITPLDILVVVCHYYLCALLEHYIPFSNLYIGADSVYLIGTSP